MIGNKELLTIGMAFLLRCVLLEADPTMPEGSIMKTY